MADFEIFAPDDATMQQALSACGVPNMEGRQKGLRYSVNYYGIKPSSPTGVYAIVRWVTASVIGNPFPPTGTVLPTGVTVSNLPAIPYVKFAP